MRLESLSEAVTASVACSRDKGWGGMEGDGDLTQDQTSKQPPSLSLRSHANFYISITLANEECSSSIKAVVALDCLQWPDLHTTLLCNSGESVSH